MAQEAVKNTQKNTEKNTDCNRNESAKEINNDDQSRENISDLYRSAGLRRTEQRDDILTLLRFSEVPLSANEIFNSLRGKGNRLNLSTVYRTLETLENFQIIHKIVIEIENMALFEFNRREHKHYLICLKCKEIRSIIHCPLGAYELSLSKETDFVIEGHSLNVYGYCRECADKYLIKKG